MIGKLSLVAKQKFWWKILEPTQALDETGRRRKSGVRSSKPNIIGETKAHQRDNRAAYQPTRDDFAVDSRLPLER